MANTDFYKNNVTAWTNAHWVFTQPIKGIYDLHNAHPFDVNQTLGDYVGQVSEIQALLASIQAEGNRARALGAGWSFSKVAATDGYLLNPQFLKTWFPLGPQHVQADLNNQNFFLFQCGMSIHDVHMALMKHGKSLPVSGSSCGQSVIGAFTTGTHGSAFSGPPGTGALQDAVRGLHVIVSPNRHVWLAPKSNPVVTKDLTDKLGIAPADFLQDDDLFYSALNGLGGFGVIHATLLEVEDLFLLDASRYYTDFASLEKVMTTFDFTGVDTKGPQNDLYHFEVINNIYNKDKGALVTIMHKQPYKTGYAPITINPDPAGEELVSAMAQLTGALPAAVPLVINTFFGQHYPAFDHQLGTLVEQNPFISYVGPGSIVCSLAMDMKNCVQAMKLCQALNNTNIPVWYEFRFVPKVNGVLAFQKFDHTCVMELAGLGSSTVLKYINDCLVELGANKIPFAFHWGKYMPLSVDQTKYGYPGSLNYVLDAGALKDIYGTAVDTWKTQRAKLFGGDAVWMKFFSNDLMDKLGLSS